MAHFGSDDDDEMDDEVRAAEDADDDADDEVVAGTIMEVIPAQMQLAASIVQNDPAAETTPHVLHAACVRAMVRWMDAWCSTTP